ncbi:MAG: hypothetical protein EA384_03425 [Spirochaetaceae bacterium]|nr:MAG: hypothetical protein EA384_03425 [Spirochaetaceae bacterium]
MLQSARSSFMIATDMAQKFVDRFCATIRYNVNVMDTDGIIIAARDTHRIGTYHEIAHALILEHREAAVVPTDGDSPPGVLPGVNLPLRHRGEVVGVVGVTGATPEVAEVAHTVRTAIEAMLEYEWERQQLDHRQDRKKTFVDALLYKDESDPVQLNDLARRCGYDPDLPRMPVVLEIGGGSLHDYLTAVKGSAYHTKQDLSVVGSSGHVTVFKVVPASACAIVEETRCCFSDYCAAIDDECAAVNLEPPMKYASGPIQSSASRYRMSLRAALWIMHRCPERLAFCSDHTHELLLHSIAPEVWHTVFDYLWARMQGSPLVDGTTLDQLGRTFMVLREENMSPKRAATRLGVHRNTVVFRMNRLNELCGLDPVANWREREMLYLLFGHMLRHTPLPETLTIASGVPFVPSVQNYLI